MRGRGWELQVLKVDEFNTLPGAFPACVYSLQWLGMAALAALGLVAQTWINFLAA